MRVNYGASFIVAARPSMPYTPMEQPTKASLTAIFISIMMVISRWPNLCSLAYRKITYRSSITKKS